MPTSQKVLLAGVGIGVLAVVVGLIGAGNSVDANIGAGLLVFAGTGVAALSALGWIVAVVVQRAKR
ncbi:hypothetical protein [Umezawaea beigongshangensis]|uniref:hypothetical protein n=1 Tax=Umezawaea beigongshangensis TaxID=2780383 RepID=UPI0018F198B0|nr:hypothetical protein [Umezawaea beigongshangensis]